VLEGEGVWLGGEDPPVAPEHREVAPCGAADLCQCELVTDRRVAADHPIQKLPSGPPPPVVLVDLCVNRVLAGVQSAASRHGEPTGAAEEKRRQRVCTLPHGVFVA
jgi:hypothetical protein